MPPTLLSLPREIRDQIYTYILISPDGFIEPSFSSGRSGGLHLTPMRKDTVPIQRAATYGKYQIIEDVHYVPISTCRTQCLSTSIIRVCSQIYHETHYLFWQRNTFLFPFMGPVRRAKVAVGIGETLKAMGQVSSRLITRACILLVSRPLCSAHGIGAAYEILGKNLQMLVSRARQGALRYLELVLNWEAIKMLEVGLRLDAQVVPGSGVGEGSYEKLLGCLRKAGMGLRAIEKVIRLPVGEAVGGVDLARDFHMAFGGKLFIGKELMWENYHKLGDVSEKE